MCVFVSLRRGHMPLSLRRNITSSQLHSEFLVVTPGNNYSQVTVFAYVVLHFRRHFLPPVTVLYMFQWCTGKFGQSVLDRTPPPNSRAFLQGQLRAIRRHHLLPPSWCLCCRVALKLLLFCWNMSFSVFQLLEAPGTLGEFCLCFLLLSAFVW